MGLWPSSARRSPTRIMPCALVMRRLECKRWRASRGRGRHGNEGPGGATAGDDRKMNNEPLEREPIDRVRARLEALLKANAAPRCGARSKRTGKPCRGAAMPNGRCKLHGGRACSRYSASEPGETSTSL